VEVGYLSTADGAIKASNVVAVDSARSRSKTNSDASESMLDIFGAYESEPESAHLMPYAPDCASLWFHFVPWVLCRMTDIQAIRESHSSTTIATTTGTSIVDVGTSMDECESAAHTSSDETVINTGASTGAGTPDPIEVDLWTYYQKCIHGFKRTSKRENGVGIKHFLTNRIYLTNQALYLDKRHCLLIVPILNVDHVKNWNGSGYSAIVLAGGYTDTNNRNISAATVYQNIRAFDGDVCFANEQECRTACTLLEYMILCVCKSSKYTFTEQFYTLHEDAKKLYTKKSRKPPIYMKQNQTTVPVPKRKRWNHQIRVRKITFSTVGHVNDNPAAPDPVLLLGKATSNWLKRQQLLLLSGCGSDDDDNDNSDGSSSSDFVASFTEEMAVRGWTAEMFEPSYIDDVVVVGCSSGNIDDEILSDDNESCT
jgi:hypothetical protein